MPAGAPHILHANDDRVRRPSVSGMLREAGFEVVEADGGQRALELARTATPDLLLCAVRLRDLDGLEVCRQIVANPATAAIPVVLYSAYLVADDQRARGLDVGAHAYLTEPMTPEVLRATLQAVLRARRAESTAGEAAARERFLFESLPLPAWVFDRDSLAFRAVNDAAVKHFGYSREEFLSMSIIDLRLADDVPALREVLTRQNGDTSSIWRLRTKHGDLLDVELFARSILFGGREARLVVAEDITERKRLEEAQREAHERAVAERQRAGQAENRWRVLSEIARSMGASFDLAIVLQRVLHGAQELCGSDAGAIFLRDGDGPGVVPRYRIGDWPPSYATLRIEPGRGAGGQVLVSGQPFRTADYLHDPRIPEPYPAIAADTRTVALMVVPILIGDRVEGLLYLSNRTARPFTDDDEVVCARLAEQGAVAIQNAELFAREQAARVSAETAVQQLRLALQAGRMWIAEWTVATGEITWSPELQAIYGYAAGTFPGTFAALARRIHPDDRDRVLRAAVETVEPRQLHMEYRILRPDGTVRWIEAHAQPRLLDADGRPVRMVGVAQDVTERKRAEEKFQLAVEAAPTAMIIVDRRGTVVFTNSLTERLLGYARHEIIGQSIDRLVPRRFHDQHTAQRANFVADPRRRPMGAGRDLHALRKDGSEVPVEIGLSPFETADGLFVLAAITDITERKRAEEERAQLLVREQAARREAEAANHTKDQFLAVLSHELRTPLTTMVGWLRVLRTTRLEPAQEARALEAIERNTLAQARMIDDLLDISRMAAGKMALERRPMSLAPVIAEAVDSLHHEANAKGVTLQTRVDARAGMVLADAHRIRQILMNLLVNAIKFTPGGGRVDVHLAADGDVVRIAVRDTGLGIERDLLPHVFERFRQADWRTAGTATGLGLGLAIVREIVELHGGTVEAQSDGPGRGAAFIVTLPVLRAAAGPPAGA